MGAWPAFMFALRRSRAADRTAAAAERRWCAALHCAAGPSRALYLPTGLLDPQDIPGYLNGSLAGE